LDRKPLKRISFTVVNDLSYDQRMQRICTSLAQNGFEVTLIGRKLPNSKPLPEFVFKTVRLPFFFRSGKAFYFEVQIRYFFYLLFHTYEYYGAVDLDTVLPNLLVARLKGKKWVYDAHEYFTEVPEVVRRPRVQRIWKWVEKISVPRADIAYTVSPGLASLFENQYGKTFGIVRNVPFKSHLSIQKTEPPFILYQGALNEGRCIEYLIPAIKGLPIQLKIAGEGDLSESLRMLSKEMNMDDQVQFLGYIQPDALKQITPQATIGFNVLENKGLSYYYSLANKCFDYLQAEVPCICSPFPEYLDLANAHPAFIFAAANEADIRLAIKEVIEQPEKYQALREACIEAKETLNWETEERILLALYEEQS